MRGEEDDDDESDDGVDVHGKLQGGEVQPGKESEEAIEAGDLVQEQGKSNELGAGP